MSLTRVARIAWTHADKADAHQEADQSNAISALTAALDSVADAEADDLRIMGELLASRWGPGGELIKNRARILLADRLAKAMTHSPGSLPFPKKPKRK